VQHTKYLKVWQDIADEVYRPLRYLPFWKPRVVLKRGRFSPWFFPQAWLAESGAFNFLCWVLISEKLLHCPPEYRKAIIAHECGHLRQCHDLIKLGVLAVLLNTPAVPHVLTSISNEFGHLVGVGALFALLPLSLLGLYKLLVWFEHRADDYAVQQVGAESLIATLAWLSKTLSAGRGLAWVEKRIQRLLGSAA